MQSSTVRSLPNQLSVRRQGPGFDTPARLDTALTEAGFREVEISVEGEVFVYGDDEQWWDLLWSAGIRRRLEVLDPPTLAELKIKMLARVQALKRPDGLHTEWRALLAVAQTALIKFW